MKRIFLTLIVIFVAGAAAFAQRWAYVDTEYILKHIPEYNSAQKQLDAQSQTWQKDVDARFADLDKMYKAYQADQVLLTDDMRKRRENEIVEREKAAKDFQTVKFGFEGDLFKEKVKLIKPIQERVSKVIQAYAENQGIDMIFDKGSDLILLYANPRNDKSNDIITRLGYKVDNAVK